MERRDLLRALASAAALTVLPHEALAAWTRVSTGVIPSNGFTEAQMALVKAIADTIFPRTDTPSATDVGVHDFVNVIVSEQASDEDRAAALAGLEAIDARAVSEKGGTFASLSTEARSALIDQLETGDRDKEPARTYWRLKGLVVHGYFTSEPVMKGVLKVAVMPGRFEGSAPVQIRPRQTGTPKPGAGGAHAHA